MRNRFLIFVVLFIVLSLNGYGKSAALAVKISSSAVSICSGNAVILTANVSGGTAPYTYIWNTGDTTSSINVNKGGDYEVIVSDATPGGGQAIDDIVINANAIPNAPTAANAVVCINSSTTLTATAPGGMYQWYDAPVGGNLLAISATYITPPIASATTYYVETTINGCTSPRTPVSISLFSNPVIYNASVCYGTSAVLSASGADTYSWYASPSGGQVLGTSAKFTTPVLTVTTAYYVVATTNGCVSAPTKAIASVAAQLSPPVVSNTTICSGGTVNLHATGAAGVYDWFTVPDGGTSLISSTDFTTPPLTSTTTFYVQITSTSGCVSARTPVTVTVESIPLAPIVRDAQTCSGTSVILNASGVGGTLQWFDSRESTTALASGNTFNTPVLENSTTYYVAVTNGQCSSPRSAVNVTVNKAPGAPAAAGLITCSGSVNTLTAASLDSGAYAWYDAREGGNLLASTETYVTPMVNSTTTYYVQITTNGCTSSRTPVTVSILPIPAAPATFGTQVCSDNQVVTSSSVSICSGSQAMLFASLNSGNGSDKWYDAPTGGNLLIANPEYITPILTSSKTYYVENDLNGCSSPRTPITVTVLPPGQCQPVPATVTTAATIKAPTASSMSICYGGEAILSAIAPGGCYQWYDAAVGGNLLESGPLYTTPTLTANKTYYVQTTIGGITSQRTAVTVAVISAPVKPLAPDVTTCMGNSATLTASGSPGTYAWYDAPTGGNLLSQSITYQTPYVIKDTAYYVQSVLYYYLCESSRTKVSVIAHPVPSITSASTLTICSGNNLNYSISSNVTGTKFSWSRATVAGISNSAVDNQSSDTINETLINTGNAVATVTYLITPVANGCTGTPFNLVVSVYPIPVVTSVDNVTICNGTSVNYKLTFNTTGVSVKWSRVAVTGLKNAAITGQSSSSINEVLYNTSNSPVKVIYVFNYQTGTCQGTTFSLVVTVNPQATITSPSTKIICSGSPLNYKITSNVSSTTFSWSRAAVPGISNAAVTGMTMDTINETLVNTTTYAIRVLYIIRPVSYNCNGTGLYLYVTINPQTAVPQANSNSPVCLGSSILLNTPTIANASYLWTGPNGFISTNQNPVIDNVTLTNTGTYNLYTIINGCSSDALPVAVVVDPPPLANAGPDQVVCLNTSLISLNGRVSGGTTTGIWTSSGSGTFLPSSNSLNAQYYPSAQDMASGLVKLTLSSTSPDNCTISTSTMQVKFQLSTGVKAGSDQTVCEQTASIQLNGQVFAPGGGFWSTTGNGTFSPSASQPDAVYLPGKVDMDNGKVTLTLHANNPGQCYTEADSLVINFAPLPIVYAGGTRYVLKDNTIVLLPVVNDKNVKYQWSPDINISSTTIKNPTITGGDANITYTLIVTDSLGCSSEDQTTVIVSPKITVPNAFTPNNDGVNDLWDVRGLVAYQNAVIDVFDRYGGKVFHSIGYGSSWDGTYNGKAIPPGTYYYVIDLKVNGQVLSGPLTVIR